MRQALSQIIRGQGMQALLSPQQLRDQLIAAGAPAGDAITLEMVLHYCPSLVAALAQGEVSWAEGNTMVSTVVRSTSLSPERARQIVGELFRACGAKISSLPLGSPELRSRHKYAGTLSGDGEEERLRSAWYNLQNGIETLEALSVLEDLSEAGNAYANYLLGEYYHDSDRRDGTVQGKLYYRRAADLGYGPAYGALADYEVNGRNQNLSRAAAYFIHPTALAGADGRKWAANAAQLLTYRGENKRRIGLALVLSLLMLALVCITLLLVGPSVWAGLALASAAGCVCRSLFARFLAPYQSQRGTYGVLLVCWLLLVVALI